MSSEHEEHKSTGDEQPGTTPMNPGDEVPAGAPNSGENICPECGGNGKVNGQACANCGGTGFVTEAVSGGA